MTSCVYLIKRVVQKQHVLRGGVWLVNADHGPWISFMDRVTSFKTADSHALPHFKLEV